VSCTALCFASLAGTHARRLQSHPGPCAKVRVRAPKTHPSWEGVEAVLLCMLQQHVL